MPILSQTDVIGESLASIARFLPRFALFAAILIVGYLVARACKRLVDVVLRRVGFDRLVERGGIRDALARADYDAGDLLARFVFYGVMLFVLQFAFGVFGPNPISDLLVRLLAFLPRIVVAIVIVVVAAAIASAARDVIGSLLGGLSYGRLLATAAYALILGIGVFAALDQLDIAAMIVAGTFYAVLAIVVGVTVVAVGGGGIAPMRARWERGLSRFDDEAARIREEVRLRREAEEEAARIREAEEEAARIREAEEEAARIREAEEEAARIREAEEEAARIREAEKEARVIRSTPREARVPPLPADEIDDVDEGSLFDPESTTTQIAQPETDAAAHESLFDPESTTTQIARPGFDEDDVEVGQTMPFDPESTTTQIARPTATATDRPPRRRTRRRRGRPEE